MAPSKTSALRAAPIGVAPGVAPPGQTPDLEALTSRLDQLLRLADDQLHLQRVALLEAGHVLRFVGPMGVEIALSLPQAIDDYLQRVILRSRGFYEARLLAQVQAMALVNAQSLVCDIGANIGNHTVYFAKIMGAGRVMAFEPEPIANATLASNIALNGLSDQVTAYQCLIAGATGHGKMTRFNPRNMGGTAFEVDPMGPVPVFALDDVLQEGDLAALDLIKIDVEGMQLAVLQGARAALAARKPAIWLELHDKDPARPQTEDLLASLGYKARPLGAGNWLYS